jgi:hypothetical protein
MFIVKVTKSENEPWRVEFHAHNAPESLLHSGYASDIAMAYARGAAKALRAQGLNVRIQLETADYKREE